MEAPNLVVFFDGYCNLCNGAVQFIIKRDKKSKFKFASLQSDYAKQILAPENRIAIPESIVLMENGKLYFQSSAAFRIAKQLTIPVSLLYAFSIFPRFITDAGYKFIAKNRYRWFGKKDLCWIPSPELKERFL